MKNTVLVTLDKKVLGEVLKSRLPVAVGFVDGDLDLVWHR
jgi:hypothetical protein